MIPTTRTPFVAANWKMHKTVREALAYATSLRDQVTDLTGVDIVVAPPFTALHPVAAAFVDSPVIVAGQDLYWEPQGAFTGEVSAAMLQEAGATAVIIGHSERRQLFGETDDAVNAKLRAAVATGLTPVVCIGETLEERKANRTFDVLERQITQALADLPAEETGSLVVAYEPVWAIGTGLNATPEQAQEAHAQIRQRLGVLLGSETAQRTRVIYGGSVKPGNVTSLATQPDVDGALVGGASLDAESFAQIVAGSRTATV